MRSGHQILLLAAALTGCGGSTGPSGPPTITVDADPSHAFRPYGVAVSAGGVVYVTRLDDAQIARYDLTTHAVVNDQIVVGGTPTGVAFTPDGAEAYVASQTTPNDVVRLANDSVVAGVSIGGSGFNTAVTPDGSRVLLGTNEGKVYILSTTTRAIVDSLDAGPSPNWFTFNLTGGVVYFTDYVDGTIRRGIVATGGTPDQVTVGGGPQGIVTSADGSLLYVARQTAGDVLVVVTATGAATDSIGIPGGAPFGLARRPGTGLLWVTTLNGHIAIVDPGAKKVVADTNVGGALRRLSFDPAGKEAVIADEDGRVLFAH